MRPKYAGMAEPMNAQERMEETLRLPERNDYETYAKQLALKKAQEALEYEEAVQYFKEKKEALLRGFQFWKRHKKHDLEEHLIAKT